MLAQRIQVRIAALDGLRLWSPGTPSLGAWMADPALLQTLLRRIYRLGTLVPPHAQYV